MEKPIFHEYRCTCGKLLMKGCLFSGLVEVKCKRCGKITSWGQTEPAPCVILDSDTGGKVARISGDITGVFGKDSAYVIGKRVPDVLERLARSVPLHASDGVTRPYEIPNNHLVLADGARIPVRTCTVPRRERGVFAGYRTFLLPRPPES